MIETWEGNGFLTAGKEDTSALGLGFCLGMQDKVKG